MLVAVGMSWLKRKMFSHSLEMTETIEHTGAKVAIVSS